MSWTLALRDAAAAGQAATGGKAVRLAELMAQGLDVPPGFVVTVEAFTAHFTACGAGLLLEGDYPTPELIARVREYPVQADVARAIGDAFDDLARLEPAVPARFVCAVRSSAADEDGTAASFAGQHATYYYTRRDDVIDRVVDCWLSGFSVEARSYRRQLGLFGAPRMAVIVQQMVAAEISGVAFTRDPTGAYPESLLIESSWGLGAALVDGRVTPDAYRVARDTKVIESRRIGSKRLKVTEALLDPKGSRLEPVPRHLQGVPTLDDARIAEVADVALACEAHFGVAQDVEWAIADGRLYVLQSRPVTRTLAPPRPVEGRWIAFKPVLENSTAPFTPLTIDLLRRCLPPWFSFIDGRLYLDFDRLLRTLPIDGGESPLIDALLLRKPSLVLPWSVRRLPRALLLLATGYLTFGTLFARTRNVPHDVFSDFGRRCEALLADQTLDPPATLREMLAPRRPFAPIGELVLHANIASVRYFVLMGLLERLLSRRAPGLAAEHVAALTAGHEPMMSREMIRDLERLAEVARSTPSVATLLLRNSLEELPHQLAVHPDAAALVEAFTAFLARYGHRGTREIELSSPRWREDPTPLFAMLRNLLEKGAAPRASDAEAEARRQAADTALAAELPGRLWRWLVRRIARRISYYAALRENTRHWHAMGFATVRRKIQSIEAQLLADGRLKCVDDIFYLRWEEIVELAAGYSGWRHVEDRARRRRIRHQRRFGQTAPLAYNLDVADAAHGSLRIAGSCASPGRADGRARRVSDPAVDGNLAPGDVLVAAFTDPTWTPLFLNAAAIVVETGSYLSHAGTIARELGIPCLVDARGIMDAVTEGQRLSVDATAGHVLLLEPATESVA